MKNSVVDQPDVGITSETARRFARSLDLNVVLSEVLSLTVGSLGADRGSIFLFDQSQRVTRHILARRNLPVEESEKIVSAVLDYGLAGWAARERTLAVVEDTLTDPRWHFFPDEASSTRSAVAIPLLHSGVLNGVMTVEKNDPGAFAQRQIDLISTIAGQSAAAVENARLFTRVRDERALLQALVNGVQQPIIVTDTYNRIRYSNVAAQRLFPKVGNTAGQLAAPDIVSRRLAGMFRRLLRTGRPQREQLELVDGNTYDAYLELVPGAGAVAVLHDVTAFKEVDRAKSEFIASVSHDLKSPLTVISGYVDLLKDNVSSTNRLAMQSLGEISSSVVRMKDLITALLDLAQIESGLVQAREPVHLSKTIDDVVSEFRLPAEEKKVDLHREAPDDLPMVSGDPVRLRQAIANLVGNAVKFTPRGGSVVVSAHVEEGYLVVQVSDSGPGIAIDMQVGLFGKFYRVAVPDTNAAEGHGLGLAIVKSVVEAHDGRVWVQSAAGQGSVFGFEIPID